TPRADTETLVETALRLSHNQPTGTVLDLGTGSGAVLLAFLSERPGWTGTGIDVSKNALAVAIRNAAVCDLEARTRFTGKNWTNLPDASYDLVLSNPPYIAHDELAQLEPEVQMFEPQIALDGGPDGLDAYRFLSQNLPRWMSDAGQFAFEIGYQQARPVTDLLAAQGYFAELASAKDLAGRDRVVYGQMATKPQDKTKI
ncbi:MAG: protein-(glutamine-N5) methyltransferase, release factor-specific, partial [Robiginitomaculum sp.]